jgi:hypothetical protein
MKKNKLILIIIVVLGAVNLSMGQINSNCIGNLGSPNPWPYPTASDGGYIPLGNFGAQNQFSISFWINPSTIQNGVAIILDASHGGSNNWVIQTLNSGASWTWGNITFNLVPNTWQNVLLTYDNGLKKIFINGVLDQTINQVINYSGSPSLYLGNWPEGGRRFSGLIDEIYISTDIIANSNFTPVQYNYASNNTWGLWHFDEGIGTTTISASATSFPLNSWYWSNRIISNVSCTSNTITADGSTTFCAGNSVNLKSDVVGGTYQWKKNGINIATNSTSRTFKASSTGSYTCVATCNGTALTSNAIAVTSKTNAAASVSASGATSFCAGDSVTLNATNLGINYSVQWYRTNISMDNATAYSQVVKQPGTYKVVTKNLTNGCSRISGSSAIVAVNCRIAGDITSGTPTPLSESEAKFTANDLSQGVNIFPNPNNGSFTFAYDGEEYGDAVLQVTNSMGQMIYNTNVNVTEGGYTQELQLGDNSTKGIYIVRLLINGNSYDSRVLVR